MLLFPFRNTHAYTQKQTHTHTDWSLSAFDGLALPLSPLWVFLTPRHSGAKVGVSRAFGLQTIPLTHIHNQTSTQCISTLLLFLDVTLPPWYLPLFYFSSPFFTFSLLTRLHTSHVSMYLLMGLGVYTDLRKRR